MSAPAATARPSGELDVFVRGTDNAVWHKFWSASGGWSPWGSLGGTATSRPGAAARPSGELDVVVRGTDNAIWHRWFG